MPKKCKCAYRDIVAPKEKTRLALCTNSGESLLAANGMRYPIHTVFIRIGESQLEAWKAQGYEFIIEQE